MVDFANNRPRLAFAVPGDLATPTGGYGYDRRIVQELRQLGWQVDVLDVGDSFPFPSAAQRSEALDRLRSVPAGRPTVVDGLALGALPEVGMLRSRIPLIALVHQPLALDPALSPSDANFLRATEHIALAATARVVVTSEATARIVTTEYGVPAQGVTVVRPGNDEAPRAPGNTTGIVQLLSVGSVIPVKGYDVLIAAIATLADLPWRLTIAGDLTRDPSTAARLDADIDALGLAHKIDILGAVPHDQMSELYLASDVFVLASRFEGYGMALTEAIAHGLPIVSTLAGAIPDTVPSGTRLLVPPEDAAALAQALRRLICDSTERRRLASNARSAARELPSWRDSARRFADAIATVADVRDHIVGPASKAEPGGSPRCWPAPGHSIG